MDTRMTARMHFFCNIDIAENIDRDIGGTQELPVTGNP